MSTLWACVRRQSVLHMCERRPGKCASRQYPRRNLWAVESNQRVTFKAHFSQKRTAFVLSETFTSLCVNTTRSHAAAEYVLVNMENKLKIGMLPPQFFHVEETID